MEGNGQTVCSRGDLSAADPEDGWLLARALTRLRLPTVSRDRIPARSRSVDLVGGNGVCRPCAGPVGAGRDTGYNRGVPLNILVEGAFMIIEFQLKTEPLKALIKNRVQTSRVFYLPW